MTAALRRILHWVGSGLALLGSGFVALRLHEYWGSRDLSYITAMAWVAVFGLAALYGLANILLALAWQQLLAKSGVHVTRLWSIRAYGVSQLAKYVPGNIFHIAGRQAIGMSAGISAGALAKSTVWELALIVLAAMLYGWLIFPLLLPGLPAVATITLLLGTVWIVAFLLRRSIGSQVSVSFSWQVLFLAISASVFVILLDVIVHSSELHYQTWPVIAGAYIVAWLGGLVTPGAPAGLGVRELILLLLLKDLVSDADLLMAVVLGRIVTVAGDLVFFGAAFFISSKNVYVKNQYE